MAPILHCIRHGQGFHNLGVQFHKLPDPKLTPIGEEQCLALREKSFPDQSKISLVTASPLSRTIHTAYLTLQPALENGKARNEILAIPDAQETSDFPCDTGSDIDVLKKMCKDHNWPVDLSLLKDGWNVKTIGNRYAPSSRAINARARDARQFLRQKMKELVEAGDENAEVVLVAHGGYLHYFTGDWEHSDKLLGTGWENCETRAYTFESGVESDESEAYLVETMESRRKRGLDHPMLSHQKQKELFKKGLQEWVNQGLQDAGPIDDEGENSGTAAGQEQAVNNTSSKQPAEVEVMA